MNWDQTGWALFAIVGLVTVLLNIRFERRMEKTISDFWDAHAKLTELKL